MSGQDLTSAQLAYPPATPLTASELNRDALRDLGRRIVRSTWEHGLPSWFWGEGVCLVGMIRFAHAAGEPVAADALDWLDRHVATDPVVAHVNNIAPGTALLLADAHRAGYRELSNRLGAWAMHAPEATRAGNGALEHWPGGVWADTAFMAGVFLGHLGAAAKNAALLNECGRQVLAHAQILQNPVTGLYAHGSHRGQTIWCYWGRGNAWCALAAVEFLELAAATGLADAYLVEQVAGVLRRQLVALAACQPAHGVWSVLVDDQPENAGIIETSAAAGIGAAMLRASRVLSSAPREITAAGWRAVRGSLGYVDAAGTLTRVSAGTVLQLVPFGYSVIRDDRWQPWGQGLALHAVAAALQAIENGAEPQ